MTLRTARVALRSEIHAWIETGKNWGLGNRKLPDRSGELYRLKDLQRRIRGPLSHVASFLETPERAARIKKREEMRRQERVAHIAIGQLMTSREGYNQQRKVIEDAMSRHSARLKTRN